MMMMMPGNNVDPSVVDRLIGDVVDMFVPSVGMSVYYGNKHVTNGCTIKPSLAIDPPLVTISGYANQLYTMVMTDPDAPSPSDPSLKEWIHWLVTDIPGCGNINKGKELLAYSGPSPPIGIHRYIMVLFQQECGSLGLLEPPVVRSHFNTRAFARELGLGRPVATVYFNAQKEPSGKRKRNK
ncbi:protease inhibitor [Lithospermum erythrorhizon]|uniref:Protease inhibitor n=1 Tax=Lithospermum erythrorhizon TaxID=34254 RepID=A0AAV3Q8U7_LITER